MEIRRINFYGGPNIGKTTLVSDLFVCLNKAGLPCGRAEEHIKSWAYEGRSPTGFDQVHLFGRQIRNEDVILRNSEETVLCEAPLLLCTYYSRRMGMPGWQHLRDLALEFESFYPALHVMLNREEWEYKVAGRYESREQALQIDSEIEIFLHECNWVFLEDIEKSNGIPLAFVKASPSDPETIARHVMEAVESGRKSSISG